MRWKDNLARIGRAAIMYDTNNLWDHIAGTTNNHRVADSNVETLDLVAVM